MDGEKTAKAACTVFWQLCERKLQGLLIACNNPENIKSIRNYFFMNCANKAFDLFCPKETARQLDAWAKNRPSPKKYLTEKNKDSHD